MARAEEERIEFGENQSRSLSRVELHGRKYRKKRNRNNDSNRKKLNISLPFILLIVLFLLPVSIYYFGYKGGKYQASPVHKSGEQVTLPSSNEEDDESPSPGLEDSEDEKSEIENPANDESEIEEHASEETPLEEVNNEQEVEENTHPDADVVYHIVQPGETLYRISMKYYQSQQGMEKIKEANGMIGDQVNAGATLIIPLK